MEHGREFADLGIKDQQAFAKHVESIMRNAKAGNVRELARGRTAYWDAATGTVVIHDRTSPDRGTSFRPDNGRDYFDGLR